MYSEFKPQRQLSSQQIELRNKLLGEVGSSRCKAVSFKMLGTLVLMPFSGESDIFAFMEKDFKLICPDSKKSFTELRIAAREAAVKKMNVMCRVTLKLIYGILEKIGNISSDSAKKLMEIECGIAERFAFPRECGKALFREAKNCKKRVIITAETIYPEDTVKRILEKCGYGSYDGLVMVSKIRNCTGESYFSEVLSKSGVPSDKLLHIGSDVAFDIELPIFKGAKALLLADVTELMAKSGRVRNYAESKKLFDYDNLSFLSLRCVFGLYAAYGFDTPQNKLPASDFCGDEYFMGFLVQGALSLVRDFEPQTKIQTEILSAMDKNPKILDGKKDFISMFNAHFGGLAELEEAEGCRLPLEFIENCCAASDRAFLAGALSDSVMKKWSKSVKEPEVIRFAPKKDRSNSLSRLADKMFPPGTKVRTIVDEILTKGRK